MFSFGTAFKLIPVGMFIFWTSILAVGEDQGESRPAESRRNVDARSMRHKLLCGYQGWFRAEGDATGEGWRRWSRDARRLTARSVSFEMWPDLSEFTAGEKYPAPGFTHADGSQAFLYSSANPKTIERHFRWMEKHDIDGVFVQRFLVDIEKPSLNRILGGVRDSAARTGRVYAVCYDMTGAPADQIYDRIVSDWKSLVDGLRVTGDGRYLHHERKPVVFVWGFYSDRFGPKLAHQIIDFFKSDDRYGATLVGGCPWYWRTEKDAEWSRAFRRFDVISPWNVGNYEEVAGRRQAATGSWKGDMAEAKASDMAFMPVIYPGFGWTNLQGKQAAGATLPRLGGEFYWRQFVKAEELGVEMAYVAMFDEVDEATAIFKVSNSPPTQVEFSTYEGLPADWYLRLTGEGAKMLRKETPRRVDIPIKP